MKSEMVQLKSLTNPQTVVIDLDTGTVLGTNLVVVHLPAHLEEEVTGNDSRAVDFGTVHGQDLYVDLAEEVM